MPTDFIYPTRQDLTAIDQDLYPVLTADDPIFDHFPLVTTDDDVLRWEQLDNYWGLQQVRGLNGDPPRVIRTGGAGYLMQPGVYGEKETVDERELTKRRIMGSFTQFDVRQPVMECYNHLVTREFARIKLIMWTLLTSGTFSVSSPDGTVEHTDSFPLQTFTAAVPWATYATAKPLQDFRNVKLLARGHSVDFGSRAIAYANMMTINDLLFNQNGADLFGRRGLYGATFNSLMDDNKVLLENGLPQIAMHDAGYLDSTGTFQPYIPNNKVVVVGARPYNQSVGEYRLTYNAQNQAGGSYNVVEDRTDSVPRQIVIHRGHSGGPVVFFPSAVVIMNI